MKKSLFLAALTATAVVAANNLNASGSNGGAACGSCCTAQRCANTDARKICYVSKEAAIEAALTHAGLKRNAVRDLKCELDREDGVMVYEVEFESGLYDYEYDIDAVTGKVLKSKKELD